MLKMTKMGELRVVKRSKGRRERGEDEDGCDGDGAV